MGVSKPMNPNPTIADIFQTAMCERCSKNKTGCSAGQAVECIKFFLDRVKECAK